MSDDGVASDGSVAEFPFSAVVGQQQLQLALTLCAVHPGIGGVLVRGEKGTAKSTTVRALARLLPPVVDESATRPARLVELPVGATEDRVIGSLDLQRVLRDGEPAWRPGLLASAHRGVLYVDEVNLLPDHLVDVLLDAAAMGRVHVERDGVSHSHPARFVLVGTMNPEEGELRPQLLDRFGLTVDVAASRDVEVRMAVVRRRLAYEADPAGFSATYAAADRAVAERIAAAQARLPEVGLDEVELRRIAALCAACEVDGMRADLVVARAATAHAAWCGHNRVTAADVRVAAELALPHRRRRDPFDAPGLPADQLDEAMRQANDHADSHGDESSEPDPAATQERSEPQGSSNDPDGSDGPDDDGPGGPGGGGSRVAAPPTPIGRPPRWEIAGVGEGAPGRRSRAHTRTGHIVRSDRDASTGLHVFGTVQAAIVRQLGSGSAVAPDGAAPGPLRLAPGDLRGARRQGREGNLVVFVVDASGSMAARDRLAAVTGATVALLRDAYQRRDKVAVISMRGSAAELVLPPTSSVDIALRRLAGLRTGGKTPLAQGLLTAREVVGRERSRDPRRRALLVLLSDGRATGGPEPVARAQAAAGALARAGVAAVVVDCERGMVRLGLAADLARVLRATYVPLAELTDDAVAAAVRAAA